MAYSLKRCDFPLFLPPFFIVYFSFTSREDIFGIPRTDFGELFTAVDDFRPHVNLWNIAASFQTLHPTWMYGTFVDLNAKEVMSLTKDWLNRLNGLEEFIAKARLPGPLSVIHEIQDSITEFSENLPLIVNLRALGKRERHWSALSKSLGIELDPNSNASLSKLLGVRVLLFF